MPQLFITTADLRLHGLTSSDVRGTPRLAHETWRLPPTALDMLKSLLVRAGFKPPEPIHVHESADPPGFMFTQ
jgi:hypothetical protein